MLPSPLLRLQYSYKVVEFFAVLMNSEESLVLSTESVPVVRLHATALFGILNNHARREVRNSRVIGTLLGVKREGFIDVSWVEAR